MKKSIKNQTARLRAVLKKKVRGMDKLIGLEELYNSLSQSEKFGLSFGLFPARLQSLNLSPEASAELIKMSQRENGIEF